MIDYENGTLNAYRTTARAAEYKRYHTKGWTWGRLVTCIEQRAIARELGRYQWSASDQLLDIPCGTGIMGRILHRFPFKIVASDISPEMMAMARAEYPPDRLLACVQADITNTPFPRGSFACVVALGFLHRVPIPIKRAALREIAALSNRLVIVSCSVDTPLQRLKHVLLRRLKRGHIAAPCPMPFKDILSECLSHGLRLNRAFMVIPMLSSHAVFILEKVDLHD